MNRCTGYKRGPGGWWACWKIIWPWQKKLIKHERGGKIRIEYHYNCLTPQEIMSMAIENNNGEVNE